MLFDDIEWWKIKNEDIGENKFKEGIGLDSQPDIGPNYSIMWRRDDRSFCNAGGKD